MTHFWSGVLGVAVAVIGALLLVFNRHFANAVLAPKGPAAELKSFQPGPTGRVPILTVISAGWVVIGSLFVWVAATGQPL